MENKEFTIAVANLAAAAINANPKLSLDDAVLAARESLCKIAISPKQIKDSVQPDKIQCLEDGTWHIMLRRYIKRKFNLGAEAYRKKWGLPDDYPFVAPDYSAVRSKIAIETGLGRGGKK